MGLIILILIIVGLILWSSHLETIENQVLEDFQKKYNLDKIIEDSKQKLEIRFKETEHLGTSRKPDKPKDEIEEFSNFIEKHNCPKCGKGHFRCRYGSYGEFFACSNYPSCKNTDVKEFKNEYKKSLEKKFLTDFKKAYN